VNVKQHKKAGPGASLFEDLKDEFKAEIEAGMEGVA
jgi:hypothetical protein